MGFHNYDDVKSRTQIHQKTLKDLINKYQVMNHFYAIFKLFLGAFQLKSQFTQ